MKNLSLSIQHFDQLVEENCVYVDKTEQICRLVRTFRGVFFARPRRFGKSLLLSTIAQLYMGRKDLFAGLWAEHNWDWEKTHPVIHFYMDKAFFVGKDFSRALCDATKDIAASHGLALTKEFPGELLEELVTTLHKKEGRRVVVLFDEYDKAILETLHQPEEAERNRKILSDFYGILKPIGDSIQFLMFTGISKFSQVSVFSKLKQLEDITFNKQYVTLLGYTQIELETYFGDYLEQAATELNLSQETTLAEIKRWYNGYTWDKNLRYYVYNPVSVMKFCVQRDFSNHWFATGTPEFLIQQIRQRSVFNIESTEVNERAFETYTLQNMEVPILLFQTGYLTLRERKPGNIFRLDYPNYEVKEALTDHLMSAYGNLSILTPGPTVAKLREAFFQNDMEAVVSVVNTLFENIPSNLDRKGAEADYHAMLYLVFRYMGLSAEAEVSGQRGRTDVVLRTPTRIYVIEFKIDQSGLAALRYLVKKGYAEKHRHDGLPVLLLGIGFSRKRRAVASYKLVPLEEASTWKL